MSYILQQSNHIMAKKKSKQEQQSHKQHQLENCRTMTVMTTRQVILSDLSPTFDKTQTYHAMLKSALIPEIHVEDRGE